MLQCVHLGTENHRLLKITMSWTLSWIPVTSRDRILAATLPERGSLRSVCPSQSSVHSSLPAVGHALLTSCRSALLTRSGSALFMLFWTNIRHVVLDLRLLRLVANWLSDSLSPGSSNLAVFTQTAGFTWSCVRSRRRCSRVRQSRSTSAKLTPTSQCVTCLEDTLACPRADPRVRFRTLTRVLRVVWETPAPPSHSSALCA